MRSSLAVAALLLAVTAAAQTKRDLRPELDTHAFLGTLAVAPSGELWLVNGAGFVFRSDDGGQSWSDTHVTPRRYEPPYGTLNDTFNDVSFFDAKHALLWGGVDEGSIFRTEDGGATWREELLPDLRFITAAHVRSDGRAWLFGEDGVLLYSDDFGRTWDRLAKAFQGNDQVMSTWFVSERLGVAGSFGGAVAITRDGGNTWQSWPGVQCNPEEGHDHRVTKVRLIGERLLITQCEGVHEAPLTAPRTWTRLKSVADFDVTPDGRLLTLTESGELLDGGRKTGQRFPTACCHGPRRASASRCSTRR